MSNRTCTRRWLALLCFAALVTTSLAQAPKPADTLIVNAKIYTVNAKHPWAEALAIRGETIAAVGTRVEIEKLRGPDTRVLDAGGRLVLPGFTDCHIHFISGSISLGQVHLEGTKTLAEIQERVKAYAAAHPGTGWILGRGWVYSTFGAEALPHKKYLDEIAPDRPVFLEGYDGHTYWANSKALELAGINKNTPNPPNGIIVRDATTGDPTGALKEAASDLVDKRVPQMTGTQKLEALAAGLREANRQGLVRVHSAGGDFEVLNYYKSLRSEGKLTLRMTIAYFLNPPELKPETMKLLEATRREYDDEWISTNAVKTMLDGVVEAHTAAMLTPYSDDASLSGKMFWDAAKYKAAIKDIDAHGFQIFTHAIGDGAVRLALDAYEGAAKANPKSAGRPRIEHIETINAADVPRFGKLGVIASMQPLHAYPDENTLTVWARNAGPERVSRAFGWQSIAKTGGGLAYGSDWPVVTLNPWEGLQNAVTRETTEGTPKGGWVPAERVTLTQAIEAYTLGAAFAGRRERTEGSLQPGKVADVIVVSQDLFAIDPHAISKTQVLTTIVGGKTVYESAEWKAARKK